MDNYQIIYPLVGAGGAMMAAATDYVISRPSLVINPSYKPMHLHGSEYWTYFLPQRVGHSTAQKWTNNAQAVGALEALEKGEKKIMQVSNEI